MITFLLIAAALGLYGYIAASSDDRELLWTGWAPGLLMALFLVFLGVVHLLSDAIGLAERLYRRLGF